MSLSPKAEANLLTHFNGTIPLGVYPNCTLRVNCLLDGYFKAQINYYPSLGGNIFCLSIFAIFLVAQATQGILWRTWKYSTAMVLGLVLECVGYYGRVALNRNPYVFNSFLIYLICLTIAPAFFTASIYLSISRLIPLYDSANTISRFAPKTYTYLFIGADLLSLVLQSIGGGLSANSKTTDEGWTGIHVMIAGLIFQVASLIFFSALCAEFALRVHQMPISNGPIRVEQRSVFGSSHVFGLSLASATVFILVRSIYRCVELAGGFSGKLANEEGPFMVLEGVMIMLACLCLTVWHPGWVLKGKFVTIDSDVDGSELMTRGGKSGYLNV